MALIHAHDLEAWLAWQWSRHPVTSRLRRRVEDRLGSTPRVRVARGGPEPRVVVVLDASSPAVLSALLAPVAHLDPADVAVVSATMPELPGGEVWELTTGSADTLLPELVTPGSVLLSTGHHEPLGALAHDAAERVGARFVTVQHRLLTPLAPPLARGATLLAWSAADAEFWLSGRSDVSSRVVGSQLLWDAATHPVAPPDPGAHPVWLGQLHRKELPRRVHAETAEAFCKAQRASYRPHPEERDSRSRATHRHLETEGIEIDRSSRDLRELGAPVVGIFSTGVLEAAILGLPAWVHLPDPPPWVEDLWGRYGLSRWGEAPTPAPAPAGPEPSRVVADAVSDLVAG